MTMANTKSKRKKLTRRQAAHVASLSRVLRPDYDPRAATLRARITNWRNLGAVIGEDGVLIDCPETRRAKQRWQLRLLGRAVPTEATE